MQKRKFISSFLALVLSFGIFQPYTYSYAYEGKLPSSYDLYSQNLVTPAKSQGPWASCWAFGALSSIESNLVKKGYEDDTVDLSEKYLIWFATKPIDKTIALMQPSALLHPEEHSQEGEGEYLINADDADRYDLGQFDWVVASALSSGLALEKEASCPYQNNAGKLDKGVDVNGDPISIPSGDGDWALSGERSDDTLYRLVKAELILGTSGYHIDEKTGEPIFDEYREETIDEVKRSLLDNGAVTINYAADVSEPNQPEDLTSFNYDHWAQYRSEPKLADHTVSVVGWDDSYPKENFANASGKLPPKDGAWKIKNSWGRNDGGDRNTSNWGVDGEGWFYLSYYDKGIESFQTYEIDRMDDMPLDIMQYDFIGMNNFGLAPIMYDMGGLTFFLKSDTPRVANVFEAPYDLEIDDISYAPHIPEGTVDIKVYILNSDSDSPEDGLEVFSASDSFKHAGYYTYKLDNPIPIGKGTKFSIVETIQGKYEDSKVAEIPVEFGYDKKFLENRDEDLSGPQAIYKAVVNPGESFVYIDDWVDNTQLSNLDDFEVEGVTYGNNLIKAFVKPTDKEIPDYEAQLTKQNLIEVTVFFVVVGSAVYVVVRRVKTSKKKNKSTPNNPTE